MSDTRVHFPSNLSRYGEVTFHIEKTKIVIEQEDGKTDFPSPNPRVDLPRLILEFNHRDRFRIFTNKHFSELLSEEYKTWDIYDNASALFLYQRDQVGVPGPLRGKCSWSKGNLELVPSLQPFLRKSSTRLFVKKAQQYYDGVFFEVVDKKPVTWINRNWKFDSPVITIS